MNWIYNPHTELNNSEFISEAFLLFSNEMCNSTALINFSSSLRNGSVMWVDGRTLKFVTILSSTSMELAEKAREADKEGFEYVTKYSHTCIPKDVNMFIVIY